MLYFSLGFKDINYDIPVSNVKYGRTKIQKYKNTKIQIAYKTPHVLYLLKAGGSRLSNFSKMFNLSFPILPALTFVEIGQKFQIRNVRRPQWAACLLRPGAIR